MSAEGRINVDKYLAKLNLISPIHTVGIIRKAIGLVIESKGPLASIGELCEIYGDGGTEPIAAEVIGFRDQIVLSMPLYKPHGIKVGDRVVATGKPPTVGVGDQMLGRVLDGFGRPLDGQGAIQTTQEYPLHGALHNPLKRENIVEVLSTGIRSIDALLTCGKGQRVGIFGGSGVGKSTLLGMMARYTSADVNVIALIGERGREVRSFIERDLGPEGLARSVVVVSTSDDSPLMRIRAALTATAIAEYFRDQSADVLLMMDSLTRFAMAQREIGIAAGEPPASKGYTPSVFALLPKLVERAGNFVNRGSITGFYTVLVEGDDMSEPVADAARSLLDGHIVLSRELAWKNHFPSIDILSSNSRLMNDLVTPEHLSKASKVRELLSVYKKAEDMINIGAYVRGSNPKIDLALEKIESIDLFLKQDCNERVAFPEAVAELTNLV